MPIVGLRIDHLSDDTVGLQLLDRLELRIPPEHEGGDALHLGLAHGVIDSLHARIVKSDRLCRHDVPARASCGGRTSGGVQDATIFTRSSLKSSSSDLYSRASTPCCLSRRAALPGVWL